MPTPHSRLVNGIRVHYVAGGSGPPLMLLHGWPQTSFMWRHVFGTLENTYSVVAPDLRGYGLTDKPIDGYDKRTMAADVLALARDLGFERIAVVGHDRGARVAHRLSLDHPRAVDRVAFLDIVPTHALFSQDMATASRFWHWLFHLQPDLPELLIGRDIESYLRYFFERWTHRRWVFDDDAVAHYVQAFSAPGALRSSLDDYRATTRADLAHDEESFAERRRLEMPVLVLWGDSGLVGALDVLEIWRSYAADIRGGPLQDCGHFLAEERPDMLVERLVEFLEGNV
jgi:haloacetate dehalogenase